MVVATAWTSSAFAQQPPPAAPPLEAAPPAAELPPAATPLQEEPPPPPAPPLPVVRRAADPEQPVAKEDSPDLDVVNHSVGIGYAGLSQVPVGGTAGNLTAPAVGARIWVSPTKAVDVALGFGWVDGSTKTGTVETNLNAVYGFLIQAGVPVALATHKHVSFQVIPYGAFAYGATSVSGGGFGVPTTNLSGSRFELGVRSGLEIFWGFIGLPQLSMSATVGAAFERRKLDSDAGVGGVSQSSTTYGIATTVQNNPWDIFTGNVAARYYF
jgi:hypothetical protein